MRLLVTGGAGFIGSHYVRSLLSGAYPQAAVTEVTVLDKLTYAANLRNLEPVAGRFKFVRGDIRDAGLLRRLMPGHDAVVNFAAETHVDRSIEAAAEFVLTNTLGTQTLLDVALDCAVRRFLQVSTDEVYGAIEAGSWSEESPLRPSSPYAASKAGGDLLARAYHQTHGLHVNITRCANNYGPYQFPEKIIPLFITNLLDGRSVPLYGDGLHSREWLHVDDHCRAIQLVLEAGAPGEIYNIGGGLELANRELTRRLLQACGADWDSVTYVADRKGHDRRYSVDETKIRGLGYRPRVSFTRGLYDVIHWYRQNRSWWEPLIQQPSAVL